MSRIFYVHQKTIDLDTCPVLYDRPFSSAALVQDFEVASGSWSVDKDGWLTGLYRENAGGIIYSIGSWKGDIIMEFDAFSVPPCCNDLNWVIKTCGWNYDKNDADRGYIMGLGGWWLNKAGMEKYPTCQPCALTPFFSLEAGRKYHILAGCICGHCFFFVDGRLVIEMQDPAPQDFDDCGRIGFGTYASHIKFKNFRLYQARFTKRFLEYSPDF